MCVQVSVRTYIFSSFGDILRSTTPGYGMVVVSLVLQETTKLSSKVWWKILSCIPTRNEWQFLLLHILPVFGSVTVSDSDDSSRCVVVSHAVLIWISLTTWGGTSFICLFSIYVSSLVGSMLKSLAYFLNRFSYYWVETVLCIFWIMVLYFFIVYLFMAVSGLSCGMWDPGLPRWLSGKESACQCRRHKRPWVQSLGWEDPLEE